MIVSVKSIFFYAGWAYMTTSGGDYLRGIPELNDIEKIGEEEYLRAYKQMMTNEYERKEENG